MVGLDAAQHARAEELLKQATSNMLMTWKGYGNQVVPMLSNTIKPALKGIADVTEMVGEATVRTGNVIEQAGHEKWGRFKEQVVATSTAIGKGAEEILRFGRDIGVTNPQLEALVGGIGRLAEGIGGIASGNLIQGITSGILGLQGIVGSLFGNSPAEMARRRILQENSDRLKELRGTIGNLLDASSPGATIAKFQGVTQAQITQMIAAGMEKQTGSANFGKLKASGLTSFLASMGLSLGDMRTLAKDMGIDLGESNGYFDPARIAQFFAAINSSEFAQFGQDEFSDRQDFLSKYFKVAGITDPGQQAEFSKAELAKFSPYLADLIKQFDINTPEGRAALQQAFAGIFQNMNNGTFDVANFGQLTGSEFVEFIEYFTDLMGEIGGGFPTGGTSAASPFPGGPPTTSAPITVTQAAAVELLTPIMETAANTLRTAEAVEQLLGMVGSGALGGTGAGGLGLDAFDAALQASRDLSSAAGVS